MILQIMESDNDVSRYLDGIRHVKIDKRVLDESVKTIDVMADLEIDGCSKSCNSNGLSYEIILNCHLIQKYGDKDYIIRLTNGAVAWLLNDEGKTLQKIA